MLDSGGGVCVCGGSVTGTELCFPPAGGHYCLIGNLVRCLLDESQGTLLSLGRIHAKLETIKMPLSK